MTKRLTYSKTKPEPRVLNCSSALLSRVIALCRWRGCPKLTTTEGLRYAMDDYAMEVCCDAR